MNYNIFYTENQINKLGNAIIFLCNGIHPLSKTKLLKLIYLIEETSVKKFGIPFFNLRFDVWKLGPVSRDLFVELSSDPILLDGFIDKQTKNGNVFVTSKRKFNDDEFTDLEIELLEQIVATFKKYTADQLIELTHRKHSPWYLTAERNGLLKPFETGTANTSDIEIDLRSLLANDLAKLAIYHSHIEFLEQSKKLQS